MAPTATVVALELLGTIAIPALLLAPAGTRLLALGVLARGALRHLRTLALPLSLVAGLGLLGPRAPTSLRVARIVARITHGLLTRGLRGHALLGRSLARAATTTLLGLSGLGLFVCH